MHVITPLKSWKPEAEGVCARDFLEQWNVEQALWLASISSCGYYDYLNCFDIISFES